MSNIEVYKGSTSFALGKLLHDGTFVQEKPVKMFYATLDMWKLSCEVKYGKEVLYREPIMPQPPTGKPNWKCGICNCGQEVKHLSCLRKCENLQDFLEKRIWSYSEV